MCKKFFGFILKEKYNSKEEIRKDIEAQGGKFPFPKKFTNEFRKDGRIYTLFIAEDEDYYDNYYCVVTDITRI